MFVLVGFPSITSHCQSSVSHWDILILFFLQVDALNHERPGTSVEASQVSVAHIPASPHVFTFLCVS